MQTVHANLLCFDYSDRRSPIPSVVAWNNDLAVQEFYACEEEGRDTWTKMRHKRFTQPVAANFMAFMLALCDSESELSE